MRVRVSRQKGVRMNNDAVLTILRIITWLSLAALFVFIALAAGGFWWIIGDTIGGVAVGIATGVIGGLLLGTLAVWILNRLIAWVFPDLKPMRDEYDRR